MGVFRAAAHDAIGVLQFHAFNFNRVFDDLDRIEEAQVVSLALEPDFASDLTPKHRCAGAVARSCDGVPGVFGHTDLFQLAFYSNPMARSVGQKDNGTAASPKGLQSGDRLLKRPKAIMQTAPKIDKKRIVIAADSRRGSRRCRSSDREVRDDLLFPAHHTGQHHRVARDAGAKALFGHRFYQVVRHQHRRFFVQDIDDEK